MTRWPHIRAAGIFLAALFVSCASAQEDVTLTCTAPTQNTDGTPLTDLVGYNVYRGDSPGNYTESRNFPGQACEFVWTQAPAGTNYFVATALKSNGTESAYSNEAMRVVAAQPVDLPAPVGALSVLALGSTPGGGNGMALDDTGLVARYYIDEADSGQGPTELVDSSGVGTPANIPISYGNNLAYTEDGNGNRGLRSNSTNGNGIGQLAASASTKLSALNNASQVTLEYVIDVEAGNSLGARVFGLMDGTTGNGTLLATVGVNLSNQNVRVNGTVRGSPYTFPTGRHVVHVVFDGTASDAAGERIKIYVDGEDKGIGGPTGLPPALQFNDTRLVVLNRGSLNRAIQGTLFYGAIYDVAFDQSRIDDHVAELAADDDTPATGINYIGAETLDCEGGNTSGTLTVPAGADTAVMMMAWWDNTSGRDITSIVVDSVTATLEINDANDPDLSGKVLAAVPVTPGSRSIDVTWDIDDALAENGRLFVTYWSGVDQTTPFADSDSISTIFFSPVTNSLSMPEGSVGIGLATSFGTGYEPNFTVDGGSAITAIYTEQSHNSYENTLNYFTRTQATHALAHTDEHFSTLVSAALNPAASGGGNESASGAATLPAGAAAGAATVTRVASGASTIPAATAAGSVSPRRQSAGNAQIPAAVASGAAVVRRAASGAATLPALDATGTSSSAPQASGAATIPALSATGTARVRRQAAGAADLPAMDGTGAGVVTRRASGAATLPALTGAGSAAPQGGAGEAASGSATVPAASAAGTATVTRVSAGAATIPSLQATGTARVRRSASGAATLPALDASGFSSSNPAATGNVALPALQASGAAVVQRIATGAAEIPALVAAGTARTRTRASGAAGLPAVTASGAGRVRRTASGSATLGALQGGGLVIVGGATILGTETLVGCVVEDTIAGVWTVDEDITGTL